MLTSWRGAIFDLLSSWQRGGIASNNAPGEACEE
jgi:hypothetical protein